MSHQSHVDTTSVFPSQVESVAVQQSFLWISRGWQDFLRHPGASLAHGLLVTGIGWMILAFTTTHVFLMAVAISSFLLVGPILATGLCELSRLDEQNKPVSFDVSLDALNRNQSALWNFALTLLAFTLSWFMVSGLIVHGLFDYTIPTLGQLTWGELPGVLQPQQVIFYMATGGLLALFVFMLSVVAVPAIIEHRISAATAMRMSVYAFVHNLPAMLVWALLIVGLTAIGFITFLVGMIVIYPLLGHATWHAYRDLIA